jgi:hypothetical protein
MSFGLVCVMVKEFSDRGCEFVNYVRWWNELFNTKYRGELIGLNGFSPTNERLW